jgi:hypothetical protein
VALLADLEVAPRSRHCLVHYRRIAIELTENAFDQFILDAMVRVQ